MCVFVCVCVCVFVGVCVFVRWRYERCALATHTMLTVP
jgi:hypothetical protein